MTAARRSSLRSFFRQTGVRYAFALLSVLAAFVLREVIEPATGTGAPFVLLFGAIVITTAIVGAGPGLLATLISAPLGAFEFVVHAGYPLSQAVAQALLFAAESCVVLYLSVLVTGARRTAERARELLKLANEAAAIL